MSQCLVLKVKTDVLQQRKILEREEHLESKRCLGDLSERLGHVGHEDSVSGGYWEIQILKLSETRPLAYHRTLNAGRPRAKDMHYCITYIE